MRIYQDPEVRSLYAGRVIDMMTGKREMPLVRMSTPAERTKCIHASDLDDSLCPLPAYYSRVTPANQYPPLSIDSALKFLRGRVIERAIAKENNPVIKDGVMCTVDDEPEELPHPVEIKSTASTSTDFRPDRDYPFWMSRLKTYCNAYDTDTMHLAVFFLVGNLPSFAFWASKDERKKTGRYQGVDLNGWTVKFTDKELKEHWDNILLRRDILSEAIETECPIDSAIVEMHLPWRLRKSGKKNYWQCKDCRWRDVPCYYYDEYIMGNGG